MGGGTLQWQRTEPNGQCGEAKHIPDIGWTGCRQACSPGVQEEGAVLQNLQVPGWNEGIRGRS